MSWLISLDNLDDESILELMEDHDIYVDYRNYLIINDISYQVSTSLLNKIKRLNKEYTILKREKNINLLDEQN